MLLYIQSFIALILGIISTITDFKEKKIKNKYIIFAIIVSCVTYIIFYNQIKAEYIISFFINLLIGIILSFCFYYFKIWAAGDAKLYISLLFMIPIELYEVEKNMYFPGIYLLIIIFSIAFIYVVIETIILYIKDKNKVFIFKIENIKKEIIFDYVIQYFMGYFIIQFINNIINYFFKEFIIHNTILIYFLNMLLLMFVYNLINTRKKTIVISIIFLALNIIWNIFYNVLSYSINLKLFIVVLIIMIFKNIAKKYNYKTIKIDNLKSRMILAYSSVIKFYSSRVKGLPKTTTESTDSRLSDEEVKSIKRWSKTKNGEGEIVIVRHLPFAPFIFLGELIFFILKLYL